MHSGQHRSTTWGNAMGLTFSVGNPVDAFVEPFANCVKKALESNFSGIVLDSDAKAYFSEELGWSGWQLLQEKAVETVGVARVPHFLFMEAWSGCYVPAETEPRSFEFDGEKTPLAVASLPALVNELEDVGRALGLPTDDKGLKQLVAKYQDDDLLIDDDMDIQTYAQLLLAAHVAQRRRQVLWVVK
jgi:hypothetical protein